RASRYWWFFGALGIFALTIAFGGHTPIYRLYYELLPGTERFRAPSLSFFVFAMSLVAMAAITLERLAAARDPVSGPTRRGTLVHGSDAPDAGPRLNLWLGAFAGVAVLAMAVAAGTAGDAECDAALVAGYGLLALFTSSVCGTLWL